MKDIGIKLKKQGIYFSTSLPPFSRIIKIFQKKEPKVSKLSIPLVICDRKVYRRSDMKLWLKNQLIYLVSAGEDLKDLDHFSRHVCAIFKKTRNKNISGVISIGGGSVGDFSGFFASIYKRGVPIIHIPTTWLAAMDSAHGGKTALNVQGLKNQVGSYWFPEACFIVKDLFSTLSRNEKNSARGELIKQALIEGGSFYKKVLHKTHSELLFWELLPEACFSKLKIVKKDPYEKKGQRYVLNFGHTLAHVLETCFGLPHGVAVLYGLAFSLEASREKFTHSRVIFEEILGLLKLKPPLIYYLKKLPPKQKLEALLLRDKKTGSKSEIREIFIQKPGQVFVEKILIKDFIKRLKNPTF